MADWLSNFKHIPINPLLESEDDAVIYFTRRDLLEEKVDPIDLVWDLPEVQENHK